MLKYLPLVVLERIAKLTMRVQMELARRERAEYRKQQRKQSLSAIPTDRTAQP